MVHIASAGNVMFIIIFVVIVVAVGRKTTLALGDDKFNLSPCRYQELPSRHVPLGWGEVVVIHAVFNRNLLNGHVFVISRSRAGCAREL